MPPRAMRERTWYRPSTRRPIIGSAVESVTCRVYDSGFLQRAGWNTGCGANRDRLSAERHSQAVAPVSHFA